MLTPSRIEIDLSRFSEVTGLFGARENYDPRTYMAIMVSPSKMALALKFAFPEFVEYRGAVFLAIAFDEKAVDVWFEHLDGDPVAVERVMNHVHLWDILASSTDFDAETELLLAPLATSWNVALCAAFPDREFSVLAAPDGGYGPELTFHSRTAEQMDRPDSNQ
ncbi:hypothetical protein ABFU82_18775 [Nocardioides sp. WV_118_6]